MGDVTFYFKINKITSLSSGLKQIFFDVYHDNNLMNDKAKQLSILLKADPINRINYIAQIPLDYIFDNDYTTDKTSSITINFDTDEVMNGVLIFRSTEKE